MAKKKNPSRKQQMAALNQTLRDTTADLLDLVKEEMNAAKLDYPKWEILFIQQGELEYSLTGEGPGRYTREELQEEYDRYCRRFKVSPAKISAACEGERCTQCLDPAGHKVGEKILFDDPRFEQILCHGAQHEYTAYVCCRHFKRLMCVDQCIHEITS